MILMNEFRQESSSTCEMSPNDAPMTAIKIYKDVDEYSR
jgi:hypothetical protein